MRVLSVQPLMQRLATLRAAQILLSRTRHECPPISWETYYSLTILKTVIKGGRLVKAVAEPPMLVGVPLKLPVMLTRLNAKPTPLAKPVTEDDCIILAPLTMPTLPAGV